MTRALVVGLLVISNAAAHGQATQQSADLLAAHPFCRPKASTPETLGPDPRFDIAPGTKPADTAPVLTRSPVVLYPGSAMDSGICGTVVVQIHVKADGKVGGVRVVESLDKINGLDADAIKTVSRWQFKPGLVDGKPAPTVITTRVEYVLDALDMDSFEAADNIGRFAKVCGYLRPSASSKAVAGMSDFEFSLDKKSLRVRIPESAKDVRDKASVPDAAVCVVGPITKTDGRPQITVTNMDRMVPDSANVELKGIAKRGDPGVTMPKILQQFNPKYTPQAMRLKIVGRVEMDAVVLTDGRVGYIRVTRSLDRVYGLDAEAVATLRRWRFEPGLKDGRPVPVAIVVQMEYRLH